MLEHLDSWSKFTSKLTTVESHYLSNFGFSNEEIDPKIRIYVKNWARPILLENFDFWLGFVQKSTFCKLDYLHNFRVSNKETDSKIGMYSKN